jgi:hypothetical protein
MPDSGTLSNVPCANNELKIDPSDESDELKIDTFDKLDEQRGSYCSEQSPRPACLPGIEDYHLGL